MKKSLGISCESSAKQMIHMKYQDLFSLKNKRNILECHLLQILLGALRVKILHQLEQYIFVTLYTNSADDKLMIFFLFYPENRLSHFIQIVSLGDNLHEMS